MHSKPRVELPIPDPEDFEDDDPYVYIPVPDVVVDYGIELLQCILGQWKYEVGSCSDEQVWRPLMVSAAQMLAGLLSAWSGYHDGNSGRLLVEQIAWFCRPRSTERLGDLEAVRTAENADIIDALLALHQARQKTHNEQQQQQAAAGDPAPAGRAPAASSSSERDPGWEF